MNCISPAADGAIANNTKRISKGHTRQNSSNGGGHGILSFLKTEIDSFVKGLSGQGEEVVATSSHDPPKKRQKRSHEPAAEGRPSYDNELDAIRQHTAHRYSAQDYVPLTAANLRASTSRVQIEDYDDEVGLPTRSSLSQSTTGRDVRTSNKPLPRLNAPATSSPARPSSSSTTLDAPNDAQEQRRRKRERAATFVNDEEARRVLSQQIKEQEERDAEYARLAEEEARRQRRKEKERSAREQRRKLERADALARLEAQQRLEEQQEKEEQERLEQEDRQRAKEEERRRNRQRERKKLEEERRIRAIEDENMRQERIQEEEARKAQLQQQQEERAAERERKRVRELEAEVERLKRELEAAKQHNERSKHVHFAPTPSDSVRSGSALSIHPDASFLSMSSTGSFVKVAHPPPPPPMAPPPPPLANTSSKASPMAIIAARKAALKSTPPRKKIPTNGVGVAMPVDMGKFLNEMKNTKLKKVGLPAEGKKEKKEESGLKGVLEHVLRKQFKPDERSSSSTRSTLSTFPSFPSRSSRENLSASTSSSITSFSSYRPLDWSFELDNAPIPPPRPSTALERRASLKHTPMHQSTNSTSSLPVPPRPVLPSAIKASRTLSHPQATSTPKKSASQPDLRNSLDRQPVQSTSSQQHLQRTQIRPQAAFGHALTSGEPQQAGRTKAQPYGHRRQNSNSLASSLASSSATTTARHYDLPRPTLRETMDIHSSTRSVRTAGQSIRSAGSSFDVDIYAQMQLQEDDDYLEEETRRSLSNPPRIDGMMDLPSPTFSLSFLNPLQPQARKVSTSKIPRSDSLNAMQQEIEVAAPPNRQALRKVSDFTHPRRAPAPPSEEYTGKHDMLGRPVSPAKAKARQRAEEGRKNIHLLHEDDEILLRGAGLTDEQANRLLQDDEGDGSVLVGYGRR